jgi:thiol-disulfide isomerase/thioredoxin
MRFPIAVFALALALPGAAQDLYPGAKAPEIHIGSWLKAGLPNGLEPGKAYVIEFWATWCGPCRDVFPHLTELAKKYKGQVEFVGISSYEKGKPVQEIAKFVEEMGETMGYNVAVDKDDATAKAWMTPAKQRGIPCSFLVSDGVIQWIGHPARLDDQLEQLAAKTIDLEANKQAFLQQVAETEARDAEARAVSDAITAAVLRYESGERAGAVAQLDELAKSKPIAKTRVASTKLNLFAKHDPAAAEALVGELAAGKSEDWRLLASYAYGTLRAQTDEAKALGLKALMAAMEAAADEDVMVCYYASLYYKDSGKRDEALKCIDRAIALLPTSEFAGNKSAEESFRKLRAEIAG